MAKLTNIRERVQQPYRDSLIRTAGLASGKVQERQDLFVSNNNAKRDYRRSMAMFQRVVKEYPQSPLVPQAKTWIGVLDVIEKSKEVDMEIERAKKKLAR